MRARAATWRAVVSVICTLALTLAVFAHRPVLPDTPSDIELAAYALPDGTLPSICPAHPEETPGKSAPRGDCEFCRIAASTALPEAPTDFVPCAIAIALDFGLPDDDAAVHQAFSADALPRGPPAAKLNS